MEIKEKIEKDVKKALKKRETIVVSTLRMLKSAIHNKEIEKRGERLQEAEVIKVIAKQAEQRKDSIEQFAKAKRQELVEKETKELEILKSYLPQQLKEEEIVNLVKGVIKEMGAKGKADFGRVMKSAMVEVAGKAEGKLVSQIVSQQLGP